MSKQSVPARSQELRRVVRLLRKEWRIVVLTSLFRTEWGTVFSHVRCSSCSVGERLWKRWRNQQATRQNVRYSTLSLFLSRSFQVSTISDIFIMCICAHTQKCVHDVYERIGATTLALDWWRTSCLAVDRTGATTWRRLLKFLQRLASYAFIVAIRWQK